MSFAKKHSNAELWVRVLGLSGPPTAPAGHAQGPKGGQLQAQWTRPHRSLLARATCSCHMPRVSGSSSQSPKPRPRPRLHPGPRLRLRLTLRLSLRLRLPRRLQSTGLCLPLWGWKNMAAVCMELASFCAICSNKLEAGVVKNINKKLLKLP